MYIEGNICCEWYKVIFFGNCLLFLKVEFKLLIVFFMLDVVKIFVCLFGLYNFKRVLFMFIYFEFMYLWILCFCVGVYLDEFLFLIIGCNDYLVVRVYLCNFFWIIFVFIVF